jgi:hypothetical protein
MLTTVCACVVAFVVSYGRNFHWAVTHLGSPSHSAFVQTELSPEMTRPDFVQCDFLGFSFDLPLGMAGTSKIHTIGGARFLEFSEGDRKIHVVLSSNSANRAFFGSLPKPIISETTSQLLNRIYKTDTGDFSLTMSAEQLLIHDWALNYRNLFSYAKDLDQIAFDERDVLHVLTLSSDVQSRPRSSKMKRLISWSAEDGTDGGLIYIYDNETATGDWGDRIAASIKMRQDSSVASIDFATATDSEILAEVTIVTNADEPGARTEVAEPS